MFKELIERIAVSLDKEEIPYMILNPDNLCSFASQKMKNIFVLSDKSLKIIKALAEKL